MTLQELDSLGKKYYSEFEYTKALECYATVFSHYPEIAMAYNNYGMILKAMGKPKLSYNFFKTAIELEPDNKDYPFNLACAYLLNNDLELGWEQFETRWKFKQHEDKLNIYTKPRYKNQRLHGKTLLITCEEGAGDLIQFARFTHELYEKECRIVHVTEPEMVKLYTNSFPYCDVISNKDKLPKYDYWTPLLSLPKILDITYDNMREVDNYITSDKTTISKFKKILGKKTKFRVGFGYKGHTKSYPFEQIVNFIKNNSEYEFINFQIMNSTQELDILLENNVKDYRQHIHDWNDTAAMMSQVDAFISIDTGLCHLAGSMGIPCFLLLDKHNTCWRWLLDRTDTYWYKSVKIIRQSDPKLYTDQLFKLQTELKHLSCSK